MFSVRTMPSERACVVEMTGEADTAVVPEVEIAFKQAMKSAQTTIVIDLGAVSFLDSRMMSVLEGWNTKARGAGLRMAIVCARDEVMRLFRIIGLDREFDFYPDRDSAVAG